MRDGPVLESGLVRSLMFENRAEFTSYIAV